MPKHGPSAPPPPSLPPAGLSLTMPQSQVLRLAPHLVDLLCPHDLGNPGSAGRREGDHPPTLALISASLRACWPHPWSQVRAVSSGRGLTSTALCSLPV